jgi:hypothetical protein
MPEPPRRQRRETAEAPVGIGGLSPHPARGRITAFRVYGRGAEIAIDAKRAERLRGTAGERFTVRGEPVLALDEPTRQLVAPLTAYCGLGALGDVDAALEAVLWRRPIVLHGARAEDVVELALTIHEHSIRKGFPFIQVSSVPMTDAAIEALCTQAGCGTIFLDFTQPVELPETFLRHLFSDHFHLWTLAVASTVEDARRCFGPGMRFFPVCMLGFRRTNWHTSMTEATFTRR